MSMSKNEWFCKLWVHFNVIKAEINELEIKSIPFLIALQCTCSSQHSKSWARILRISKSKWKYEDTVLTHIPKDSRRPAMKTLLGLLFVAFCHGHFTRPPSLAKDVSEDSDNTCPLGCSCSFYESTKTLRTVKCSMNTGKPVVCLH